MGLRLLRSMRQSRKLPRAPQNSWQVEAPSAGASVRLTWVLSAAIHNVQVAPFEAGVGALKADEERTFTLSVEVRAAGGLDALRG